MIMDLEKSLALANKAARAAGEEILKIYHSDDFGVEFKKDQSPLTKADKVSHQTISDILESSGLPILSEEGRDVAVEVRKQWEYFWLIDPIDGTKEFLKRNGEFTVNIALIHQGMPILGVVLVPVTGDLYHACQDKGAFKNGERIFSNQCEIEDSGLRVVASRSHMNDQTRDFIENLNDPEIISKGSSLKLLMVAEGEADIYPRFGPTMEWDTAAAHAIVIEAGGKVVENDTNEPLGYNKKSLLNPYFIVEGKISNKV